MGKGIEGYKLVIVLVAIAMVGLLGYMAYNWNNTPASSVQVVPAALTQTGEVVQPTATVSCPSDGTTDGQARYQDMLASTVTYDDATVYFVPQTAGEQRITAGTLQTDGTYSTAVNLKCTESGTKWQAVAVTKQDDASSAVGDVFVAEGSYSKVDLKGKNIGTLQFKVEDKVTGGAKFFNISGVTTDGQGYTSFNGSTAVVANDAAYTGTSLALAADGYVDSTIYVKTASTKTQYGEDGLRTFMLVNADGSAWSEPIVGRDAGAKLVNIGIAALSADDQRHYSGYEYVYEIGSFDDREHKIDFYLQTAAGVDPGASNDPTITFCAEGRYASVKSTDAIKIGCWTDAATQAEVFTASTPIISLNIA